MSRNKRPIRFTGQHFTIDQKLISNAIHHARINPSDIVLDIGAGSGYITVPLSGQCHIVIAIEKDVELTRKLLHKISNYENIQIHNCDIRNFVFPQQPFKVVSNIPYHITSDILRQLMFENLNYFRGGTIILQLEPALKLFSQEVFNAYTLLYRIFYDLKIISHIDPSSFYPPPRVLSALLRIELKKNAMDFNYKHKFLAFGKSLLQKPELSARTVLKSIFRKSQVRALAMKYGIDLDIAIVRLSPFQWQGCFMEMIEAVPEKFHPELK